jgi:Flp pilus assembly protein TadG
MYKSRHQYRGSCDTLSCDKRGSALLEATIVVPTLLLIGLGVLEFGNFFYQRHLIEAGVRDAARYLAALPRDHAASKTDAESIALTGELGMGTNYRVSWWNPLATGYSFTITYPDISDSFTVGSTTYTLRNSDGGRVYSVQVATTVQYQSLGFLTGFLGLGNLTVAVDHEERHFGNR